ncbi:hypothetical protein QFZ30_002610 [Arthrobacter pascens]|nr:hypothetical protein [Arthrobacter pascens]
MCPTPRQVRYPGAEPADGSTYSLSCSVILKRCPEHPFGYGRERYIYAFIVSIVLFSVDGLLALYEAWGKLQHPHAIEGDFWWVPLAVLVGAIVAESFSFRTAIIESNHVRGKQSWVHFVRNAKQPELPVILLEDLGALVGTRRSSERSRPTEHASST